MNVKFGVYDVVMVSFHGCCCCCVLLCVVVCLFLRV